MGIVPILPFLEKVNAAALAMQYPSPHGFPQAGFRARGISATGGQSRGNRPRALPLFPGDGLNP